MQKTALIIPCFNEESRLLVDKFLDAVNKHPWLHFIFVNDGSTDGTLDHIKELTSPHPIQIQYIDLGKNLGKALAVWHGFQKAIAMDYDNIGYWDADLATPLSVIEEMCRLLSKPEICMIFGSRVRLLNRKIRRKALRHYTGRLFATIASLVLDITIYDTQCGAKIFKNNPSVRRVFNTPFSTNWIFDVEIFARFCLLQKHTGAAPLTETAIEYPLHEWTDIPGSKLNIWDFIKAAYEITVISLFLHSPGGKHRCQKM